MWQNTPTSAWPSVSTICIRNALPRTTPPSSVPRTSPSKRSSAKPVWEGRTKIKKLLSLTSLKRNAKCVCEPSYTASSQTQKLNRKYLLIQKIRTHPPTGKKFGFFMFGGDYGTRYANHIEVGSSPRLAKSQKRHPTGWCFLLVETTGLEPVTSCV